MTFRIGIAAVLRRNGRILMIQRQGSHGAGTWCVPGGHIDPGETPAQTAAREVQEEVGLVLDPQDFLPMTFTTDVFKVEGKKYITLYFETGAGPEEPRIMEPEKISDLKWVEPPHWPGELFLPLQNFIKQGGKL